MKYALIIGNDSYSDPKLAQLKTPAADSRALANVLGDENIGGFDEVTPLINQTDTEIRRAISSFLEGKRLDDLVLVYFSGHGVLDSNGRLYLASKDTLTSILRATAIPSAFISDEMDNCRSRRQILILDCCHSGAFARGTKAGEQKAVTASTFEGSGYGRVVLTASDATQYALEGDQVIPQAELSLFTYFLLEGLQTGRADTDNDGFVSLDEWYDYTYTNVLATTPTQVPHKWSYRQRGDLLIAKNPHYESIQREAAEKIAREEAERLRQEKEKRDREILELERTIRERLDRESVEKSRLEEGRQKENLERERNVFELAAPETEKHEPAEKIKREQAERTATQIPALKESTAKFYVWLRSGATKAFPLLRVAGFAGIVLALFWFGSWGFPKLASLTPTPKASSTLTLYPSATTSFTDLPASPSINFTPTILLDTPVDSWQSEAARIRILNGSQEPGLDVSTGNFLLPLGVRVTEVGTADMPYANTVIVVYSSKPSTLQFLSDTFTVTADENIIYEPDANSTVDIEIRLGNDWKLPSGNREITLTPTPLPTEITDTRGVSMVLVPEGEFMMGSENGDENERPVHQVYLDAFYMDIYEVTNMLYKACVESGECQPPKDTGAYDDPTYANHPVVYVDWNQAQTYCEWRDASLPTEAQWEKAARGTDSRTYPWGEEIDISYANYGGPDMKEVGSYPNGVSPYGVFDMAGNAWEWVEGWYDGYPGNTSPDLDYGTKYRVLRGGSRYHTREEVRATIRENYLPFITVDLIGFRCAKDASP